MKTHNIRHRHIRPDKRKLYLVNAEAIHVFARMRAAEKRREPEAARMLELMREHRELIARLHERYRMEDQNNG